MIKDLDNLEHMGYIIKQNLVLERSKDKFIHCNKRESVFGYKLVGIVEPLE